MSLYNEYAEPFCADAADPSARPPADRSGTGRALVIVIKNRAFAPLMAPRSWQRCPDPQREAIHMRITLLFPGSFTDLNWRRGKRLCEQDERLSGHLDAIVEMIPTFAENGFQYAPHSPVDL